MQKPWLEPKRTAVASKAVFGGCCRRYRFRGEEPRTKLLAHVPANAPPPLREPSSSSLPQHERSPSRPACVDGSRCRNRDPEHRKVEAHPLDHDYVEGCGLSQIEPEPLTLKVLFDCMDTDGSGRLSREELKTSLGAIKQTLADERLQEPTDEAWEEMDDDGNSVVNFSEFCHWAGPRLGLPLGMKKMRHKSVNLPLGRSPCNAMNCPCQEFVPGFLNPKRCANCHHKEHLHMNPNRIDSEEEVPFPEYWVKVWDNAHGDFNELVPLNRVEVSQFQKLVDQTYSNVWTRDRKKHNPTSPNVPQGYCVKKVLRNENSSNWREYGCRRAELLTRMQEEEEKGLCGPRHLISNVKSMVAWRSIAGMKETRLEEHCNEWYVFHGTSPNTAKQICATDFHIGCAGSNTGTLYGRGLYFAESITKADEYARVDTEGSFAVLMCRVLGGRVLYTDEEEPDPQKLLSSCLEGPYDSVLGDREACRNTYREFVFFDTEDVYPEYIIHYQRLAPIRRKTTT